MISNELKESFYNHSFSDIHPLLKDWLHSEELFNPIISYLDVEFAQLNNLEFAQSFKDTFPDIDVPANQYLNHLIEIEMDSFVIAGIRFKGLNPEKPFVDIISNYSIYSEKQLMTILNKINQFFRAFKPLAIRFWSSQLDTCEYYHHQALKIDQHYLANLVKHIKTKPLPPKFDLIKLKPITNLDFYPKYERAYQEFIENSPILSQEVLIEAPEAFDICIQHQLAFEIYYRDNWIGIIAAMPSIFRELSGYCVFEEIISVPFQRQGFAKAAQRHLIHQLPEDCLLWGSIHANNLPSLKTAKKNYRHNILDCCFIDMNYPFLTAKFKSL